MPCNVDPPTRQQTYNVETARLLRYVMVALGEQCPSSLTHDAIQRNFYNQPDRTAQLCQRIRNMTPQEREKIVYDAHYHLSRDLADWWEQHQAEDKHREQARVDQETRAQIAKQARAKLTPEEIEALGIRSPE